MVRPELITFDCAGTLIEVDWRPGAVALEAARSIGCDLPDSAEPDYDHILRTRWPEYLALNLTRDEAACERFWIGIAEEWAIRVGVEATLVNPIWERACQAIYSPNSTVFRLYDDVLPTLNALQARGIRLAVLSNWDISLHKVLRAFDLWGRFDLVCASLEHGVEKPDPALFRLVLEQLGVEPEHALHVGDDPLDDYQGAKSAGMRALLLDRARLESNPPYVNSLKALCD